MNRHGLTLVELVVLILCLIVLAGIFLPLLGIRDGQSRRIRCLNNLRSIGQGAINYASQKGHFPGYAMDFGTFDPADNANLGDLFSEGDVLVKHRKIGTWGVAMMPYLDEQARFEHWTDDRYPIVFTSRESETPANNRYCEIPVSNISVYQCPSDPRDMRLGANSYACNSGMYHASPVGGVSFAKSMSVANGVFNNKFAGTDANGAAVATGPDVGLDDLTDGLSQTLLFAENINVRPWHAVGFTQPKDLIVPTDGSEIGYPAESRYAQGLVWHYEDDKGAGGASKVANLHHVNGVPSNQKLVDLVMTLNNAADLARPSSAHPGGANAVFSDGSTCFLSDTIDYRVYQAILTPNGSQSDCPDPNFVLPTDFTE